MKPHLVLQPFWYRFAAVASDLGPGSTQLWWTEFDLGVVLQGMIDSCPERFPITNNLSTVKKVELQSFGNGFMTLSRLSPYIRSGFGAIFFYHDVFFVN